MIDDLEEINRMDPAGPTNEDRQDRAAQTVAFYGELADMPADDDDEEKITDLLADLMHLHGEEYMAQRIASARAHYEGEGGLNGV